MGNTFTWGQERVTLGAATNKTLFLIRSASTAVFAWITEIFVQDHSVTGTDGPVDFALGLTSDTGTSTDQSSNIRKFDRLAGSAAGVTIYDTFTVEPTYTTAKAFSPIIAPHGGSYTWRGRFPVVNERAALRMLNATTAPTVSYRITWQEGLLG